MNKCFTQQPPPMQVRAEVAGPDPALCALPLDLRLCLISVQRQSRDPQVSANSRLQGQGRSAVSKTSRALRRSAHRQLQPPEGMIIDTSKKHILLLQQTASALPHSILACPVPEEPELFLCCDRGSSHQQLPTHTSTVPLPPTFSKQLLQFGVRLGTGAPDKVPGTSL